MYVYTVRCMTIILEEFVCACQSRRESVVPWVPGTHGIHGTKGFLPTHKAHILRGYEAHHDPGKKNILIEQSTKETRLVGLYIRDDILPNYMGIAS